MNEAFKLAVEKGGYLGKGGFIGLNAQDLSQILVTGEPVLDPLFWQALGKALGWKENEGRKWADTKPDPMWQRYAIRYFSLFLTGGDTEKFFEELIIR